MPFQGAPGLKTYVRTTGFFTGPLAWQQTEANGRDILALDEDVHDQDMAAAIDTSLQRNGANSAIADIPMNNFKFTGLGPGIANGDSLRYEQMVLASPFVMSGGVLVVTASGNILTIALKRSDGISDASIANPILISFHSYLPGNGVPQVMKVVAPLSMTVSAGSTLGAAANAPFKCPIVIFNDGVGSPPPDGTGTLRLGIINGGAALGNGNQFASATAEGGAGAADLANTIYASAAVVNKPFRVLGYATWATGLPVPGNWAVPSTLATQAQTEPMPQASAMPVGAVIPFASGQIPPGWQLCNGQALSRAAYPALFATIGIAFGTGVGGDATTFGVPDLRGRMVAHYDPTGINLTNSGLPGGLTGGAAGAGAALSNSGGEQGNALTSDRIPAHTHTNIHNHQPQGGGVFRTSVGGSSNVNVTPVTPPTGNNGFDGVTSGPDTLVTGNQPPTFGLAHNNLPPLLVLYYIIFAGV